VSGLAYVDFAVLTLGPLGVVELVDCAEVAGDAADPSDGRLFDAANYDAFAVKG